jgi:cyanate permease
MAGADLRLTLLAVLMFGLAAVPGSLLIARIGPRRALIGGLCLVGFSSALRGLGPSVPMLFAMTLSAGTFAISYSTAFLVTLLTGAVWDATHIEASAFLPAMAGSAIVATFAPRLVATAADVRN